MCKTETTYYKSPIGNLKITGNKKGIQSVIFVEKSFLQDKIPASLQNCVQQLNEYFKGNRKIFTIKLNLKGTEFQKRVWESLQNIPFNTTQSYLEQAKMLGNIKAIRAVATANGKNPVAIIVPCHRVIGSDGSLTGYAGGIGRKKWLLEHENRIKQQTLF